MEAPPGSKPCPGCSHLNPPGQTVCGRCGHDLSESFAETLTAAPPQPFEHPDPLSFKPGETFGRRYIIVEEIGRGGMGRVYKARDTELDVDVALKMIQPQRAGDPSFIRRFKQETLLGRAVSHENVIRLYDLGEVEGVKFISMEFVKGQNLSELIQASGKLSEETAVGLAVHVCRALAAAHKLGIIHRDLKPQNVLIDRKGLVRVADFGLAGSAEYPEEKSGTGPAGTPAYMSPEQIRGESADSRSDIYSLGVMLYEMVTGRRPFEGKSTAEFVRGHLGAKPLPPSRHNPRLSPALEALILKCLEKDKARRFPSTVEILEELDRIRDSVRRRAQKIRRAVFWAGGSALGLLIAALAVILPLFKGRPQGLPPADGRRITVAVMYFENNTGDPSLDYLRKTLSTLIIQDLLSSRFIRVITGEQLYQILKDLRLEPNQTYSQNDLKKVAERAQASFIVHGSLSRIADVFNLQALMHGLARWELKGSHSLRGRGLEGINAMVDDLTLRIKQDLDITQKQISEDIDRDVGTITTDSPDALRFFWEATELFQQRKFAESNGLLEQALARDPQFALAYYKRAQNHSNLRNTDATKNNLEKALALADRTSPRERFLIRGFYAALYGQNPREAIDIYEEFLREYPDDESGLIALAVLYRRLEDWDAAEALFEKARIINIYNDVPPVNLSYIAMAKGRYDQARNILETNRDILTELNYHYFLGLVLLCQGRYEPCLEEIRSNLAADRDDAASLLLQGHALALSDDFSQAEHIYRRVLENPGIARQVSARLWLARLALARGRFEDCRREISQGLLLARDNGYRVDEFDFLALSAYLAIRRNHLQAAEEEASAALRLSRSLQNDQAEIEALHLLGWAQAQANRPTQAQATAENLKIIALRTENLRKMRYYHHLRGRVALQRGEAKEAAADFEQAVTLLSSQYTLWDDHAIFLNAASLACQKQGDLARARQILEDIANLTSGRLCWGDIRAEAHLRLARLLAGQGRIELARKAYRVFFHLFENADPQVMELQEARREMQRLSRTPDSPPPAKSGGAAGSARAKTSRDLR